MDDLLALMGDVQESDVDTFSYSGNELSAIGSSDFDLKKQSEKCSAGIIDPLTKIRIIDRMRSKVEIVDVMCSHNLQFQLPESISNMSKAMLTNYIVKPSENNSSSGKSNIMTMGIVFSNSGTKMSKNGRGFCLFTIGDLHTGPTISVLLFGSAYLTHLKKVKPGDVIAVLAGTVLPSQNGRETRISMSVNESDQIIFVGKAMDYGLCSMVEKKRINYSNAFQSGVMEQEVQCHNYVDLRCNKYCKFHLKKAKEQQQSQQGSKKRQTFIKNARQESRLKNTSFEVNVGSNMTMIMPGEKKELPVRKSLSSYTLRNPSVSSGGMSVSLALHDALYCSATQPQSIPNPYASTESKRSRPLPINVGSTLRGDGFLERSTQSMMMDMRSTSTDTVAPSSNATLNSDKSTDLLGEALKKKVKSAKNTLPTRKRHISDLENFDGRVQVPKPNQVLFGTNTALSTPAMNPYRHNLSFTSKKDVTPSPDQQDEIREKQRLIAQKILHGSNHTKENLNLKRKESNKCSSAVDTFLDCVRLSGEAKCTILATKSKFSAEADSALYARSRQTINELEKHEAVQHKRDLNKQNKQYVETGLLKKEYICNTCKKVTKFKPQTCIRQKHGVKLRREITKKDDLADNRIKQNTKAAKEGGLLLGSGLEWSEWNHSNN